MEGMIRLRLTDLEFHSLNYLQRSALRISAFSRPDYLSKTSAIKRCGQALRTPKQVDVGLKIRRMMEGPLELELMSEKTLHQTAEPQLLSYCPSMDLVAIASTDDQVLIYRLNGQRVYGTTKKGGSLKVESIRWEPNGTST